MTHHCLYGDNCASMGLFTHAPPNISLLLKLHVTAADMSLINLPVISTVALSNSVVILYDALAVASKGDAMSVGDDPKL